MTAPAAGSGPGHDAPGRPGAGDVPRVSAFGIPGIGEVRAGDDLAGLLLAALSATGRFLADGDVVAVSSKVMSKAEGRSRTASGRDGAIDDETVRVVAERLTPRGTARIVQSRSGPVLAAAGVDASNVAPGTVLTLPADPDASARALLAALRDRSGRRVGVVVCDTLGRPWRQGQTDAAIGAAGIAVVDDLRGGTDPYGNPLEVTVRAVADEVAALADLVKGKLGGVPAAVVRGLGHLVLDDDGPGAAQLLRPADQDWFRLGHVEAVRTALGVPPGTPGIPPRPVEAGTLAERLHRALAVVRAGDRGPAAVPGPAPLLDVRTAPGDPDRAGVLLTAGADGPAALVTLGAVAQRVLAAARAEDLDARVEPDPQDGPGTVRIAVRPRTD